MLLLLLIIFVLGYGVAIYGVSDSTTWNGYLSDLKGSFTSLVTRIKKLN